VRTTALTPSITVSDTLYRLEPLTSSQGDQVSPKALLPILNKPVVSYALNWLEEANVNREYGETASMLLVIHPRI